MFLPTNTLIVAEYGFGSRSGREVEMDLIGQLWRSPSGWRRGCLGPVSTFISSFSEIVLSLAFHCCPHVCISALAGKPARHGSVQSVETPEHWLFPTSYRSAESDAPRDRYKILGRGLDSWYNPDPFFRIPGVARRIAVADEHLTHEMIRNYERQKHTGHSIAIYIISFFVTWTPCSQALL
jgi:hypothetical protein